MNGECEIDYRKAVKEASMKEQNRNKLILKVQKPRTRVADQILPPNCRRTKESMWEGIGTENELTTAT